MIARLHILTVFVRSLFKGAPEIDQCYAVLAARREPVFRDFPTGPSPWAGRRRAARHSS